MKLSRCNLWLLLIEKYRLAYNHGNNADIGQPFDKLLILWFQILYWVILISSVMILILNWNHFLFMISILISNSFKNDFTQHWWYRCSLHSLNHVPLAAVKITLWLCKLNILAAVSSACRAKVLSFYANSLLTLAA